MPRQGIRTRNKRPVRRALRVPGVMPEACDYSRPAAFSRGLEVKLTGARMIFVSGTASVGPDGKTRHARDFAAQARLAYANVAAVLHEAGADWHDVVKTTIYLKNMAAHYRAFNAVRNAFFRRQGLTVFPASTCVEATLCRPELLIEMEVIAVV